MPASGAPYVPYRVPWHLTLTLTLTVTLTLTLTPGHHVVEHFAKNTNFQLVVLDKLSYASKGYDRLRNTGVFHLLQTYCVDLCQVRVTVRV